MPTRGRPSQAQRLGLDVDLTEQPGGTWRAVVKDGGTVVFDRDGYRSTDSARKGVGVWVRKEHGQQLAPSAWVPKKDRSAAPARPALGHSLVVSDLAAEMDMKADDQEADAVALRQQADRLEAEAKRLRSAAEVLRGPDGD
jgi:hypothetical protein